MNCENCIHDCVCMYDDSADKQYCSFYEEPRPKGTWINEDYGIGVCFAECSECGEEIEGTAKDNGFGFDYSFPNFCPNCGASMVKEEGDEK